MHARSSGRHAFRTQALGLCLVLGTALPAAADAARVQVHVSGFGYPAGAAIDLHVAREDLALDYDDSGEATLRLKRLGLSFYETLGASSRMGLRLGRVAFSQSGRPTTAGLDPLGWFAELDFAGAWPADSRVQAAVEAAWRYSSVSDSDPASGDEVELDWHTLELRPALRLALGGPLRLDLGASVIAVDGSERSRGATRASVDFSAAESAGGFLSLAWHRADRDVIALRLRGGNPAGLSVVFEHRY